MTNISGMTGTGPEFRSSVAQSKRKPLRSTFLWYTMWLLSFSILFTFWLECGIFPISPSRNMASEVSQFLGLLWEGC